MLAYVLKYKKQIPSRWLICPEEPIHECYNDDCCRESQIPVNAGIPVYPRKQYMLNLLIQESWELTICYGKTAETITNKYRTPMHTIWMQTLGMCESETLKHIETYGFTIEPINL